MQCSVFFIIWVICHPYFMYMEYISYNMTNQNHILDGIFNWQGRVSWRTSDRTIARIFFFDELGCTCPIFSFLSDSEGICLQAAALQLYFLAVSNRKIKIPLVESDLEQAAFYRLWGPYHGY